jgi:hypothetical protein
MMVNVSEHLGSPSVSDGVRVFWRNRSGNQEWTIKNGQSRMDNQEWTIYPDIDTIETQDTGRRQTKQQHRKHGPHQKPRVNPGVR